MAESRLSIVIDSRTAEQKAKDVHRALQALEDAGVRVTATTESVSSAMAGQAQQSQRLVTNLNSARGAMGRMQQAQASIKSGQKGLFQPVQAQQYAQSVNRAAQATDGAAKSYQRAGLSAAQLRQAQQQLPMQFTDIFTSLASGQPVMQVFLQQGGQLKDIFGGVGPALRGMAGYVASLINPMTLLAGTTAGVVIAFESGRDEAQQFNNTLIMTGNQAGTATDRLMQMAAGMDSLADTTQNRAAAALTEVVRSGKFTAEQFRTVTETALLMENATGQAIDKTIEQFGKIADDPVDAVIELNEEYGFLTEEVYNNIRALEESGDTLGAQRAAMDAYADTMRDRASDVAGNLGWIEEAARGVAGAAKEMWDGLLNIGREDTLGEEIEQIRENIARVTETIDSGRSSNTGGVEGARRALQAYELQLAVKIGQLAQESAIAEAQGEQNDRVREHIELQERQDRLVEENLTARREIAKVEEDIAFLRERQAQASSDAERQEIGDAIQALQEQKRGIEESTDAYRDQRRVQKEAEREAERLMKAYDRQANSLSRQIALYGETGEAAKVRYDIEHGALQNLSEARKQELVQEAEAVDKINEKLEAQEEYEKRVESILDTYDSQARKTQELRQAVETLNRAYKDPEVEMSFEQYQRALAGIQEEMRKVALESDPLTQDMARAWEEASNRVDETFADAFAGAFDSFDDFASQLEDAFKRLLAELAYQATLRPIVVGFTSDMQGALGIGGGQQGGGMFGGLTGGGGLGGSGNLLSTGRQLYNGVTGGIGNIAWTGAPTSYGGGFAGSATAGMGTTSAGGSYFGGSMSNFSGMNGLASAGAGYIGTQLGGAAFGETQTGQHLGTAGAAIGTYFGGPVGAAIGSFIGSSIGSAFSDKYAGEDPTGTLKTVNEYGAAGRDGFEREVFADSALGRVGFARESRDIDSLFGDRDNFENAQEYAEQLAQMDNTIAQLASSEAELAAMREAAADYGLSSMGDLEGRYESILGTLDGAFGRFVRGIDGGVDEIVDTAVPARQALTLLADGMETLNLRFRDGSVASYRAAGNLAELMSGVDALASAQQQYYQSFFTDAERFGDLEDDLSSAFDDLGVAMPDTAAGFRDLVEAQNLMTEAGREQYAALLQLVPTMSQYLDVMDQQHSQLQDWIDSLLLSDQSTLDPSERLQESQSQYASLLVQAENGDTDAMGSLGNVAQQYLAEAASYYGQASGQYGSIFDEILDAARGLGVEIDGSHAAGLGTVPFDGYRAELHRGETVLPAPIAQLYRDSAPGGSSDGEMLRTMQAMHQEMTRLRNEVRQLRGERGEDAARAASQRDQQLRAQEGIDRNTRTPVTPL
ncbi:Prophage tail length tape measure protein [Halomonas sp. THAF12]|uniref:phage tail length tape measure family protein n=1 Tax=Halomonas sp. THAF12 TaxID=2587849 RepID=UPI001268F588|nr:phage tail length tape measure family protein [Halomonas sp. THAF12]QFT84987.1 Prophage tail length tape measure protein [Halomonas sp. THAF12]